MSDSVQPHRRQPTRLPRPWDSPGRNTGVGCHFFLQCMKVKKCKWSCLIVSDSSWPHGLQPTRLLHPWDLPGKVQKWDAIAFSVIIARKPQYLKVFYKLIYTFNLFQSESFCKGLCFDFCMCFCLYYIDEDGSHVGNKTRQSHQDSDKEE